MSSAKWHNTDLAVATDRARLLVGCYRKSDAADPEVYARAIVAVFMRYPKSVIIAVTEPATSCHTQMAPLNRRDCRGL
jgi:hypothetical protein